jgi:hypothetical protein
MNTQSPSISECEVAHITHTGFHAGLTWCGTPRNTTEGFAHLGLWVDNPQLRDKICPECRALLDEPIND